MILSKEDTFCDDVAATTTANGTDVLDFGAKSGNDVLHNLCWFVYTSTATSAAGTAVWQTSDDGSTWTDLESKPIASGTVAKSYPVENAPLPRGLKRYNRLKISGTGGKFTAAVVSGMDDRADGGAKEA